MRCISHEEETMTCEDVRAHKNPGFGLAAVVRRSVPMGSRRLGFKSVLAAVVAFGATAASAETPKRGGILTFMIPADARPEPDGHRETTFAVVHATAPFYSVLIRVNPDNPSSTTDFRCDLCTEMPKPTDNGLTYTFKIRKGVKFHDGTPLTAQDVAASWNKIVHPPKGVASARQNNFVMVDTITAPDDETVVFKLKFATLTFLPALADPYTYIYSKKKLDQDMHWYEKNIMGSGPFRLDRLSGRPVDQGRAQPGLLSSGTALPRRLRGDLRAEADGAHRRHPRRPRGAWSSARCRRPRATSSSRSSATRSSCRRATGTAATW